MNAEDSQASKKPTRLPSHQEMFTAFQERDASCDDLFFVGVTTTGIFCRPSCPARKPRPENVVFYSSAREALLAGFRPCRRCAPLENSEKAPEWATRLIAEVETNPARRVRDADLRAQGLDPAIVRRYFQSSYGVTFQTYCRIRRLSEAFAAIKNGKSIDEVVFGHGWQSHSGFRDAFAKVTGMTPGEVASPSPSARSRKLANTTGEFIRVSWAETPLGRMLAGATSDAICLLEFPDRRMIDTQLERLRRLYRMPLLPGASPLLDRLQSQLDEYFAKERVTFDVPLEYPGSDFQRRVWNCLRSIPYGETRSYAGLARDLGEPRAARAVGRANGQNRIAILIPCHRVIAADGGLGGYGGGLWRKLRLLETEGASDRISHGGSESSLPSSSQATGALNPV